MKRNDIVKTKTIQSIETQIIWRFMLIVGILLFVMWVLEIIFFEPFYENVRMKEIYQSAENIISVFFQGDDKQSINEYSFKNNLSAIIVLVNDTSYEVVYSGYGLNDSVTQERKIEKAFYEYGRQNEDYVVYQLSESNTVAYFRSYINDDSTYFIYLESVYAPLTSTYEVFIRLLLLVSVIGFIIATFFSYFLSKNLSEPILNISNQAKQLVNGNLDMAFTSEEYQEVKQLSNSLNYAVSEIKKSQALQKEVIGNISHELKTPLTMIQSYAELINDISGDDKEKREEHLAIILEETERLKYLVDDIMQYSKLESGTMEYNYSYFNIVRVLKKLEEFYVENFSQKGYEFEFIYSSEKIYIYADKNRIEQVIINLINNAINYSLDKKVIKVSIICTGNIARLAIRDQGIGISPDDLEHIFEKHFRSVGARRVSVGSGIGLSICKSILNAHKFRFGVRSELGKGSLFYIDFSITEAEQVSLDSDNV